MANLNRQIARESRTLYSPTRQGTAPAPAFIAIHDTVDIFKTYMPPFLKKLMENLSIKYSKIACSIRNLKIKLKCFDEIIPGQELPTELKFQQKYYESLANAEIKEAFVRNLLSNKKAILSTKIAEIEKIYESRYEEIQSLVAPFKFENCGSELLRDCGISWEKVLDSFIQIQICTMTAKSEEDQRKKTQKREKFEAKKEELSKPKIVTIREFEKLTAELKSLKLSNQKSEKGKTKPKNAKGEKTVGKSPSPKKKEDQKKTQAKRKAKTQSRGSGNTKGTSAKKK